MWWWVAAGVAVGAMIVLAMIGSALRRDLAELQRVAELAHERTTRGQQRLQAHAAQVQATVGQVTAQAAELSGHAARGSSGDARNGQES